MAALPTYRLGKGVRLNRVLSGDRVVVAPPQPGSDGWQKATRLSGSAVLRVTHVQWSRDAGGRRVYVLRGNIATPGVHLGQLVKTERLYGISVIHRAEAR